MGKGCKPRVDKEGTAFKNFNKRYTGIDWGCGKDKSGKAIVSISNSKIKKVEIVKND